MKRCHLWFAAISLLACSLPAASAAEPVKLDAIPADLAAYKLELSDGGREVIYSYDTKGERTGITSLLSDLRGAGIRISDLDTTQSSLEDIFVSLVRAS